MLAAVLLIGCAGCSQEEKKEKLSEAGSDNVTNLYKVLEVTGEALEKTQIFSFKDLEELAALGQANESLKGLTVQTSCTADGAEHTVTGLDMVSFLQMCGADFTVSAKEVLFSGEDSSEQVNIDEQFRGVLVLTMDDQPMENGTAVLIETKDTMLMKNVNGILVGSCCDNPHYEMHNREPHSESADSTFTFNIYKGNELVKSVELTTAQLEKTALENPDAVFGGYYGVIGDVDSIVEMGAGGFLDYFEGIRFDYVLKELLGLDELKGSAQLYGREGEMYSEIEDLSYFVQQDEAYYSCTNDGKIIEGAVPVLAYSKNGAPLLPEHEHDGNPGYIKYNTVKDKLEELGIEAELGTVKNHSGPFVAALGNCAGFYGGYQVETGADCVRMDIHLK